MTQIDRDLEDCKAFAEELAKDGRHNLGEWIPYDEDAITSSCQNEGCRTDAFIDTEESGSRGTAIWGNIIRTSCPMS